MEPLWVSAAIQLTEGTEMESTRSALAALADATRTEPGCLKFDILQDNANPSRFLLWEHWVSADALAAHFKQPHTLAYLAENRTEVVYIEKLSAVSLATEPTA